MTIGELLQLNPQHLEELRDLYAGFTFEGVEIVARDKTSIDNDFEAFGFNTARKNLRFDSALRGKTHTHCIFVDKNYTDDTFYCFSFAKIGEFTEAIIFKLTC